MHVDEVGAATACPPVAAVFQSPVDALPESRWRWPFFSGGTGEQEILDAETAAERDLARAEPGDDIPLDEFRRDAY